MQRCVLGRPHVGLSRRPVSDMGEVSQTDSRSPRPSPRSALCYCAVLAPHSHSQRARSLPCGSSLLADPVCVRRAADRGVCHCVCCCARAVSCCVVLLSCSPVVRTVYGSVEGYEAYGVNHYLGLPFAAAPVGPLRFRQPTPPHSWEGTRHAFLYGSVCPQLLEGDVWIGDEDCLYLNVYSPANVTAASGLPVLVWLYGGAFVFGDGYEFGLYSATNLISAHQSYIVVTLNYRLAALGFLALDSLRPGSATNSSGNAGVWDQLAALEWVRDNIGAFGGNASRVTLAGESAGAISVCIHLASPYSRGLFSAAVLESGTCDSDTFFVPYNASVEWSTLFARSVGCGGQDRDDMLQCLQRLPLDKLVLPSPINTTNQSQQSKTPAGAPTATATTAPLTLFHQQRLPNTLETVQLLYSHGIPLSPLAASNRTITPAPLPVLYPTIPWAPTIDSALLLDTPLASIERGDWARVPLVVGTNKDEGSIFISQLYSILPGQLHDPLVASDLPLILYHVFGNDSGVVDAVLAAYPIAAYPTVNNLTEVLMRDWFFACPSRRLAAAASASASAAASVQSAAAAAIGPATVAVWLYEFSYIGDWVEDRSLGVYHSSELEFVFDNAWPPLVHSFSAGDQRMSDTFGAYWANLVVHSDVNVGERTAMTWERWTAADKKSARLDVPVQAERALHAQVCDFWDTLSQARRHSAANSHARPTVDIASD